MVCEQLSQTGDPHKKENAMIQGNPREFTHSSFKMRAERLASLMVNKPFSLKGRLLSTVEFSTRHGKIDNLDIYGRNLNTLQYYSIDVVAFLATLILLVIVCFVLLCRLCMRVALVRKSKEE